MSCSTLWQADSGETWPAMRGLEWANVKGRLGSKPEKLWSLGEMESSGGEPDVVGQDKKTGDYMFFDCSPQSPEGRTSLCYDGEALDSRKNSNRRTAR